MSAEPLTYFGIDLGTTYSAISYIDDSGRPTVVRNLITGGETTPSAVYFENATSVVVGASAKNVAKLYPDRVVQRAKREMGRERQWEFDGVTYTPESISALILKQLAQDAQLYSGRDVRQVVITVPAYFGMLERDATRNAGRIAGLDVIGIVPEPVAAALQYEVGTSGAARTVLVYDLGGGTFDTTVIQITASAIDVLCTDGDQELGGTDWDTRLTEFLLQEFVGRAHPGQDPADDPEFMQELILTAENTKRELSAAQSRQVPLRFAGASAMIEVTREAFAQQTQDLLDRTIEYTDRTLDKLAQRLGTNSPKDAIHEVLLVGGATKMPAVAARLKQQYGWQPRLHDPDLAVAKGAARFALSRAVWAWDGAEGGGIPVSEAEQRERIAVIAQRTGVDEAALTALAVKRITNVLPKAFGVRLIDTSHRGWEDDPEAAAYISHLVHADESLPSGPRQLVASTVVPNQTEVDIAVYEQAGGRESADLSANKAVDHGAGMITGLPANLPVNSPIEITMEVNDEGLLSLNAVEPRSKQDLTIRVRVSVLSEEEVSRAEAAVSAIQVRS
jgi:molecular chaperone DnaK (HSP70)